MQVPPVVMANRNPKVRVEVGPVITGEGFWQLVELPQVEKPDEKLHQHCNLRVP